MISSPTDYPTNSRRVLNGPEAREQLTAEIVISPDGPAECTIFPIHATLTERTTTWITAKEGSFLPLTDAQ